MEQLQISLTGTHSQLLMLRALCEWSDNDTGTIQEQITAQLGTTSWEEAKLKTHDISGIEGKPENYKYQWFNGCFYPACKIIKYPISLQDTTKKIT